MKPSYTYLKNDQIFYKWLYYYIFHWKQQAVQFMKDHNKDVQVFEYLLDCLSATKIKESIWRWLQAYQFKYRKDQIKAMSIDLLFLHKEVNKRVDRENLFFSLYIFSHAWFVIQFETWKCIISNDYEKVVEVFSPLINTLHNIHSYLQTKTQKEQQEIFSHYWIFFLWLFSFFNNIKYAKTNTSTIKFEYWLSYIDYFLQEYHEQITIVSNMHKTCVQWLKSLKLDFYVNSRKYRNENTWSVDMIINSFWNRFKEYNTSLWFDWSFDRLNTWLFLEKDYDWKQKKILYVIDDWRYWWYIMNNNFKQKLTLELYKIYFEKNSQYEREILQKYKDRMHSYRYYTQWVLSTTFSMRNTPYDDLTSFLRYFNLNIYQLQIIFLCLNTYFLQLQENRKWMIDYIEIETLLEDLSSCLIKMLNWLKAIKEQTKNDEFFQRAYNLEEYNNTLEFLFQKLIDFTQMFSDLY